MRKTGGESRWVTTSKSGLEISFFGHDLPKSVFADHPTLLASCDVGRSTNFSPPFVIMASKFPDAVHFGDAADGDRPMTSSVCPINVSLGAVVGTRETVESFWLESSSCLGCFLPLFQYAVASHLL